MIARAEGSGIAGLQDHGRAWAGVLGPPFLLLLTETTLYALVPWTCNDGGLPKATLHGVVLVSLLLLLLSARTAWRVHQRAGGGWPGEGPAPEDRDRFLGLVGILSALLFGLVLLGQWLPTWILDPCLRAN